MFNSPGLELGRTMAWGFNQGSFTYLGGSMQMVILMDFTCIVWVGNIMTPVEPTILSLCYP